MAQSTGRVSIVRGTAIGFVADVVVAASALGVSVGITRLLLPADRGIYFLSVFTAGVVALLGDLGATIASMTYAANGRIALPKLHGLALGVTAAATASAAGVLVGAQPFWSRVVLKGVGRTELAVAAVGVAPVLYAQVCAGLLTGLGRIPELSAGRVASALVTPAALIPAAWVSGGDPRWALVGWLGSTLVFALTLGYLLVRAGVPPRLPNWQEARELLSFGLKGQIGTISHQGFLRLDVLFLSARGGPAVVGWYSLASVVAEKLSLVGSAIYGASAARVGRATPDEAARLVIRLVYAVLLVLVPAGLVLALLAHPLIGAVFGHNYAAAAKPLQILIPGTICLVVWYLLSLYIVTALRRPGLATLIQLGGLALSVPLYYFGIRRFQMTGAAAASSIVYGLVLATAAVVFVRTSGLDRAALRPRREDLRRVLALVSWLRWSRA